MRVDEQYDDDAAYDDKDDDFRFTDQIIAEEKMKQTRNDEGVETTHDVQGKKQGV